MGKRGVSQLSKSDRQTQSTQPAFGKVKDSNSTFKIYHSEKAVKKTRFDRLEKRIYGRKSAFRQADITFILFCEGTKTEPNYFKKFPVLSASVQTVGTAHSTMSLIEYGEEYLKDHKDEFDEIWFVFDKDSFSDRNFNEAIRYCEKRKHQGYHAAYSNEAFELWYLLHFERVKKGVSRSQYGEMLTKRLKEPYKKNSTTMYDDLLELQPLALINAAEIYDKADLSSPAKIDPLTSVHLLVEALNKYIR